MSVSPPVDENALGDRELVSLYMKYPELNLIFDDDEPGRQLSEESSDLLSSPATSSTWISGSTTRTTPLRPDAILVLTNTPNEYHELLHLLQDSDLPSAFCIHFTSIANRMLQIGGLLFRPHEVVTSRESAQEVSHHCEIIVSSLEWSCQKVQEQIFNIAHILTLAPFTVKMDEDDLLPNYRQKAELIIKHVKLPSRAEREVLKSLARVYDAYVYNPALVAARMLAFDDDILTDLNRLYDLQMTLLEGYKRWCKVMVDLKTNHMSPVVSRILTSPILRQKAKETEETRGKAEHAARALNSSGLQSLDEKVLEALRVNARRKVLRTCRVKTRFRREHTL